MDINNSVIVITAAGSTIGQSLALHFLSLDANVILVDSHEQELNQSWTRCQKTYSRAYPFLLDDLSFESIQLLYSSINHHFSSGIDVLINLYPHIPSMSLLGDSDVDSYSRQLSSITTSMLCFSKLAAQQMLSNKKPGVIVNVSNAPVQSCTKGTNLISELTQTWAKELMPFKIRVAGIQPNFHQKHWIRDYDELVQNTEYVVENDFFNGRVLDMH